MRLIATDLDGTLLRPDGTLSPGTRDVLRDAVAAGVQLVILTARPPRFLDPVADALDLDGVAICANGAMGYDLGPRITLWDRPLKLATARAAAAALAPLGVCFAVETGERVICEPAYSRRQSTDLRLVVDDLDSVWRLGVPLIKLLAWHPDTTADALLPIARAALGAAAEVTHSGGAGLLEISAPGVSKVAALADLCATRGVAAADVVAFGDMPNDIAMLAWAGRGVAVANAHHDVLAAADEITASNEDDGVARFLAARLH